ncbi:hypothetical protein Syun_011162 [Stephania yunnanensis]|uniref:Putative rRNA methyltransferase n=1 Tax=Stephania yunnanensis TaxID=152371 RepID=A0AAP0JX11_9MAGN
MGKVKGKHRLDKFYHLAKEQGYRSRAAFKLLQLDDKYHFLNTSRSVLDLCAAPGGWMQVAVQRVPVGSLILGIDLFPIPPIRGAISVVEDITTPKCRASIKKVMGDNGCGAFDLVLHDGSPNVGGAWAQEAMLQASLVIDAVKLATQFLSPKGTFVTKVFRSQDYNAVRYCLEQVRFLLYVAFILLLSISMAFHLIVDHVLQLFGKVEVTKPESSRSTSAEIFIVCQVYKAPAKIDPRLLDIKHLFQGPTEPPKPFKLNPHYRYEDGMAVLRKVCLASDFVSSEAPLDVLGTVTSISFEDPACLSIKEHELTTEEVKALCDDLRVLGKQDFKYLLKWRMNIRKALSPSQKASAEAVNADNDDEMDEDDKILNEMEELKYAIDRKKKREKNDKLRRKTGMQIDVMEDGYVDAELFSMSSIKGKKGLKAVESTEYNDEDVDLQDSDTEEAQVAAVEPGSSSDIDSDEENRRYDEQLEEFLDQAYERYVSKIGGTAKQRKRTKRAYLKDNEELLKGSLADNVVQSDPDSDKEPDDDEANPLMVPLHDKELLTQDQIAEQWFSQDIFAKAVEEGELGKHESDDEMEDVKEAKSSDPKMVKGKKKQDSKFMSPQNGIPKADDDFEVVPAPATDSSDDSSASDSSESEVDDDSKAEILAFAKKMLRKKQREQIQDDAYNKYMFDDEGLPTWFLEEEKRHRQLMKPITKEEVAAMRAQFKEIDARPAKKVAQAKARKKKIAMRKLDKVRQKANAISDQTDIADRSKRKLIDQLYRKAAPKKPKKEYVVAKKGVANKASKGKVLVDRRMKKDMRVHGMGRHGKGKDKGKGNGKGKKGQKGKGSAKPSARKGNKGSKGKKMNMGD